jgi:hypothetical protein
MSHQQVCSWLQLPSDQWPPDHYTLLGLPRGEDNLERIEQRVHERLARLRCYQLNHPDQVTEAMNLLARAFSCLTNLEAKRAYDAALKAGSSAPELVTPVNGSPETAEEPADTPPDPLAWLFGPWSQGAAPPPALAKAEPVAGDWSTSPPPSRISVNPTPVEVPVTDTANGMAVMQPTVQPAPAELPVPAPRDPIEEMARSVVGRRGLVRKRDLYFRIARTRRLLYAWDQAGKFLNHPTRRLARSAGAAFLTRQLTEILQELRDFPPLLGEAGQPGAYVVALARQPMIVPTFRTLLFSQRETLARDWRDGRKLLAAYRRFLRQEVREWRCQSWFGRLRRRLRASLSDHPFLLLPLLGVFVIVIWLLVLMRAGWLPRFLPG